MKKEDELTCYLKAPLLFLRTPEANDGFHSGSTDIAGTENISKAILARVGYSFALPFHYSKISVFSR